MNVYLKKPFGPAQGKQHYLWQKITIGITAITALVVILNIFSQPIKNTFHYVTAPISKVFWQAGDVASGFFGSLLNANGINQENNNLRQERENLLAQISALKNTIHQQQSLQEIAQFTQGQNFNLKLAQTIGLDTAGDTLLIDRGFQDGIMENMPVISSTKVLVGKTNKVYQNFSEVMLISHNHSVVDVKIPDQNPLNPGISGAIKGSGNLSLYLDLVSSQAQINQQETVFTSGLEGVFPKDLLVGTIISIDRNDVKPFQTAQIQPFFDIKNIGNLFIITNYLKK